MKIVFTSVKPEEKDFFESQLKSFNPLIFPETIDKIDIKQIEDTDILSVFVFDKLDRNLLSKLKNLKMIVTRSAGVDHIDLEYCKENNIQVAHLPAYSPKSIAEHTFALILALTRKLKKINNRTQKINYKQESQILGEDLFEKSIGIIGTGRIGTEVAKMALAFFKDVYAYDIKENPQLKELGVKYIPLEELFKNSDIISLHVPYTPQTHYLINAENINKMKDGVILINTSRGRVVNTDHLYQAIMEGKISAAGLDVFEEEDVLILEKYQEGKGDDKNLKILKLNSLDNVIITPHIAYYTETALNNIRNCTVEAIKNFIEKKDVGRFRVV